MFLTFSRPLNYSEQCEEGIESCSSKKIQEKHENHWITIRNNIKVINWPYKFMTDTFHTMIIEKNRKLMALP